MGHTEFLALKLPVLNDISPMESEMQDYFWHLACELVKKWILSIEQNNIFEKLLSNDDFAKYVVSIEVRGLIVALITYDRMKNLKASRNSSRILNELNLQKIIKKLKLIKITPSIVEDLEKELEWLTEMRDVSKSIDKTVIVNGWYEEFSIRVSNQVGSLKTITMWYLLRIEKLLKSFGYETYSLRCSEILFQTQQAFSADESFNSIFNEATKIKIQKQNFTVSQFDIETFKSCLAKDRETLKQDLKKFRFSRGEEYIKAGIPSFRLEDSLSDGFYKSIDDIFDRNSQSDEFDWATRFHSTAQLFKIEIFKNSQK